MIVGGKKEPQRLARPVLDDQRGRALKRREGEGEQPIEQERQKQDRRNAEGDTETPAGEEFLEIQRRFLWAPFPGSARLQPGVFGFDAPRRFLAAKSARLEPGEPRENGAELSPARRRIEPYCRTLTVTSPFGLVPRRAGLYIASAWTGGSRNVPGATARTRV